MALKGQKHKRWTAEEKYKIIKPVLDMEISTFQITKETGLSNGMINNWIKVYRQNGYDGLVPKTKYNNPLAKYYNKKNLTKEEQLEYENMKLKSENEMLKKGYLMKGEGTIVKFMK